MSSNLDPNSDLDRSQIDNGPSTSGVQDKKKNKKECQICFDVASGCHFGVMACEGCKGFFRRNIQKNAKFVCFYDNKCDVFGVKKRKSCQKCRMDACLKQGMNAAMIKKNNINNRKSQNRSRSEILAPPRRDFQPNFSSHAMRAMDLSGLPRSAQPPPKVPRPQKLDGPNRTPFDLQMDKTAGFERMRYSLGDLNPKRNPSPEQKRNDHLGDSGIALSANGDEDGRSAISRASTANTESSRPSVIRKSEHGRIYIMDSVTRDYHLDAESDSRSFFAPIPIQRTLPPVEPIRCAASLPPRPVKRSRPHSISRSERLCDDTLTMEIFKDIDETKEKVRRLCENCYQFKELNPTDRVKLMEVSMYELILIYVYFENRNWIQQLADRSNSMMRGIVDSLNKCEIQSWSEATLIIMMSLFGHHSTGIIFVDPEIVARLKQETQESLQRSLSDKGEGGSGSLPRHVNVLLLLPRLREVNDLWRSSKLDKNGAPINLEKPIKIKFGDELEK